MDPADALELRLRETVAARMAAADGQEFYRLLAAEDELRFLLVEAFGRGGRVIEFDPLKHPRGAGGQFRKTLSDLGDRDVARVGPDVTVRRNRKGGLKVKRRRPLGIKDDEIDARDEDEAAAAAMRLARVRDDDRAVGHGRWESSGEKLGAADFSKLSGGEVVAVGGRVATVVKHEGRLRERVRVRYADGKTDLVGRDRLSKPRRAKARKVARSPGVREMAGGLRHANPAADALHFIEDVGRLAVRDAEREAKKVTRRR